MSTRSRVGIKNEDGTITSVYVHHDGYPSGVGEVLFENYNDETKIRKLMELGDMSSIGTEPVDNPRAWETPGLGVADWLKAFKEIHREDMCDTYKSRGEDCPASISKTEKEFEKKTKNCWGEYAYLYKDGKWYINKLNGGGFRVLTEGTIKRD